jgi:hypothetical protein
MTDRLPTPEAIDPEILRLATWIQGADMFAIETMVDFGTAYFNPMIQRSEEKTFEQIERVMQLLHSLIDSKDSIDEIRPGLAIVAQTVWAAAQYESNRLAAARTKAGEVV